MKHKIVEQQCYDCGHRFALMYHEDGSYTYLDDPCECKAEFFSLGPSLTEWLTRINRKHKLSIDFDCKNVSLVYPDRGKSKTYLEYIFEDDELDKLSNFLNAYDCVLDVDLDTGMSSDAVRISFKYDTPDEIVKDICNKAIEFMWGCNVDDVLA
jgi:hypothetical protein